MKQTESSWCTESITLGSRGIVGEQSGGFVTHMTPGRVPERASQEFYC